MQDNQQKAIIYSRTASVAQNNDNSCNAQHVRCRNYAEQKGYSIVNVFHDEGVSGREEKRSGIAVLLNYLSEHKSDNVIVIVEDISRLARSFETHIQLRNAIATAGGKLESLSMLSGDGTENKLIEHPLVSAASYQQQKECAWCGPIDLTNPVKR